MSKNHAALKDRAFSLLDYGDKSGAQSIFEQVCEQDSHDSEARMMLGVIQAEAGDINAAEKHLMLALELDPEYADSYFYLANIQQSRGQLTVALASVERAVELDPDFLDAQKLLVQLCKKQGDEMLEKSLFDKAEFYFMTALKHKDNDVSLLYKLALVARSKGKIKESVKFSERVINIDPNHIRAKAFIASSYELLGDVDKGNQIIEDLIVDYPNHPLVNIVYSQYALRNKKQGEGIAVLTKMIDRDNVQKQDLVSAIMLLGSLHDSIKEYDLAFKYYKQANDLQDENYNPSSYQDYISGLIKYFSKEKYLSIPSSVNSNDELIFIVGMPRSWTSLIEQIISSHSNVFGAGELTHVYHLVETIQENEFANAYPECLDGADTDIMNNLANKLLAKIKAEDKEGTVSVKIIDKMPHNFHHIGFIHKLFPNAKFINCVRDARDTCLSCYFQSFAGYHPYACDLHALGVHYHEYERLMGYWENELEIPVLTVSYENVVLNTRKEVERILSYLELNWEEKCMEFYKRKRTASTASYNQVNKKIYSGSVGRWKNYEKHIEPLVSVLYMPQ